MKHWTQYRNREMQELLWAVDTPYHPLYHSEDLLSARMINLLFKIERGE